MQRLLCALFVSLAALAAQDRPMVGQVVDDAGTPVANAEVTLAALDGHYVDAAQPHIVRTTTDDRGRFRSAVHGDLDYAMFAIGPARADGQRRVGAVHLGMMGSALATIVVDRWRGPTTLHCSGLAAWGEAAPRRGRARLDRAPAIVFDFEFDADGVATLPPMPVGIASFELLDATGQVLLCSRADTAAPTIALPAPTTITFHVVDDAGKPIAGALVEQRAAALYFADRGPLNEVHGAHWRSLGRTGADGTLLATLATDPNEWVRPFRVRADGHAMGVAAHMGAEQGIEVVDVRNDRAADRAHLHFTLLPARPLRGRILRDAERPLADTEVTIEVVPLQNGGSVQVPMHLSTRTDQTGAFSVADVPADFSLARLLAPPSLTGPHHARLPPLLADVVGRIDEFPLVRLDQLDTVDVQALRADGGPAEGAIVVLVSLDRRRWFVEPWDPSYRLDRAGRLRLCRLPGEFLLFCIDGSATASATVTAAEEHVELRLEPTPTMTIRVVDADGKAVPQAQVGVDAYGPADGTPMEQALGAVATSWFGRLQLAADGDGVVRFPCLGGAVVFQLRANAGGRQSEPFRLQAGTEVTVTLGGEKQGK